VRQLSSFGTPGAGSALTSPGCRASPTSPALCRHERRTPTRHPRDPFAARREHARRARRIGLLAASTVRGCRRTCWRRARSRSNCSAARRNRKLFTCSAGRRRDRNRETGSGRDRLVRRAGRGITPRGSCRRSAARA
jgi:hypothetical protein